MSGREQGTTLVELMIVAALLVILAQVAVPAWQDFIFKHRSQALQHSIERSIQLARSQAITRRTTIELCGSQNGQSCSNDWSSGWLMQSLPAAGQPARTEQVTRLDPRQPQLQWAGFRPRVSFDATGYSTASNGRFYVCRDRSIDWQLILNRQGRLRRGSSQENREQDHRCNG